MDIENQGPEALLLHLREEASNPEDRVSIISTMASQYVSYHEFAESLNSLLFHLIKMMSFSTFQEVLSYFSGSLKKVFNCEEARIWLDDKMTGILMTYSEKGMALKAMSGRGLLGKSMDSLQALNSK